MTINWFLKKWRIARVPLFAAHLFAHRFVIIPAANKKRKPRAVRARFVVRRLRQAHRNWVMRLKELVTRNLWTPAGELVGGDVEAMAILRCINCRPTSLEYRHIVAGQFKFCGRNTICPFCAARQAEDFYRRLLRAIRQLRKTEQTLVLTCRIETYKIAAQDFFPDNCGAEVAFNNIPTVRATLLSEIAAYKKIRRKLARNTFGSAWRVVTNPIDNGWEIQIRQLFITRLRARRPVNRSKKSARIFLQSAKLNDIDKAIDVVGCFVEYPRGLLTSYVELTATALHARTGLRLNNATGIFYRRNTPKKSKKETRYLPDVP